ncbi:hypothetical protein ACQP1W_28670 [Spirillospora sp. CA-255316]
MKRSVARLQPRDVAVSARTGTVRLHGKGDQVRTVPLPAPARNAVRVWLDERGRDDPLWLGQRGAADISGIVQVVLAVGKAAERPDFARTGCATPAPPGPAVPRRRRPRADAVRPARVSDGSWR